MASTAKTLALGAALVFAGAVGFHELPGMISNEGGDISTNKWIDSFYCSTITLTTVGYGDICPTSDINDMGKLFLVILSFLGLGFFCGPVMDYAASWRESVPGGTFATCFRSLPLHRKANTSLAPTATALVALQLRPRELEYDFFIIRHRQMKRVQVPS